MLSGLMGDVGMDDVFDAAILEEFAVEPKENLENLDGTPLVTAAVSPLDTLLSELGNRLFELLLDAGL